MRRARMLVGAVAMAAVLGPAAGGARAEDLFGITSTDQLVRGTPLITTFGQAVPLTGLAASEHVKAIDVRPATGGLYGLAVKGSALRLVRIDQATGAVTTVGTPVTLSGTPPGVGLDFDPDDDVAEAATGSIDTMLRFAMPSGAVTILPPPSAGKDFSDLAYVPPSNSGSFAVSLDYLNDRLMLGNGSGLTADSTDPLGYDIPATAQLDFGTDGSLWMYASTKLFRIDVTSGDAAEWSTTVPALGAFAVRLTGDVAFGAAEYGVGEGAGTATITFRRAAPTSSAARVQWSTADDTATAGADYAATSGEVSFAPGQSVATATVPIVADSDVEGTERLRLTMTSVDGVPAGPAATLLIADDDQPPPPAATTPPAPLTADPDRTPPVVLALPLSLRQAAELVIPFATSEAGPVTVLLRLRAADAKRLGLKSTLARATLTAKAGENRATLRIARKTLTALRKRARLRATARIEARDAAGNAAVRSIAVTLRRR